MATELYDLFLYLTTQSSIGTFNCILNEGVGLEQEDDACKVDSSVLIPVPVIERRTVHDLRDGLLGDVDSDIGLGRRLVRVVDTGEVLDLALASTGVETLPVVLLAVLQGGSDVDEEVVATRTSGRNDMIPCGGPRLLVRRGGGRDDSSTRTGEFCCDECDTLQIRLV